MTRTLTPAQRRDRSMSEDDLRRQVEDIAAILGYSWVTIGQLRTQHGWRTPTRGPLGAGWPDYQFIHRTTGRIVFAELKAELGRTSPDQDHVLGFLRSAGLEAYVWRPSDFDRIAEVLK